MTDFALTEAERMIKRVAHDFAAKEMAPRAMEYDQREEFPWDIAKKGAELGLHGEPLAGPDLEGGGGEPGDRRGAGLGLRGDGAGDAVRGAGGDGDQRDGHGRSARPLPADGRCRTTASSVSARWR